MLRLRFLRQLRFLSFFFPRPLPTIDARFHATIRRRRACFFHVDIFFDRAFAAMIVTRYASCHAATSFAAITPLPFVSFRATRF